jgi:hypothetical protein
MFSIRRRRPLLQRKRRPLREQEPPTRQALTTEGPVPMRLARSGWWPQAWLTYLPVPADSMWTPVESALDSNERTARLCCILLVLCVPTVLALMMLRV